MKSLTFTLDEELALEGKYNITPDELMFIRAVLLIQDEESHDLLVRYMDLLHACNVDIHGMLVRMQEKGIILSDYRVPNPGEQFEPELVPFNKNFLKNLYRSAFELGKELFDAYPQTTVINGYMVTLRGVSKHFNSLEECYSKYGKCIKWNEETHKEIIDLVNWAKEKNMIQQSLSSFVVNNAWLDLQAIRDNSTVNYDTIKML